MRVRGAYLVLVSLGVVVELVVEVSVDLLGLSVSSRVGGCAWSREEVRGVCVMRWRPGYNMGMDTLAPLVL